MVSYTKNADLPNLEITWLDDDGNIINYSSGYTFTAKVGVPNQTAVLTVTTGFTGASVAPNLTLAWAASAFSSVTANEYALQITARETASGKDRELQLPFELKGSVL